MTKSSHEGGAGGYEYSMEVCPMCGKSLVEKPLAGASASDNTPVFKCLECGWSGDDPKTAVE